MPAHAVAPNPLLARLPTACMAVCACLNQGDYHTAIKILDSMDLERKGQFTRVNVCYVSTHYYLGFALLLMRQYVQSQA